MSRYHRALARAKIAHLEATMRRRRTNALELLSEGKVAEARVEIDACDVSDRIIQSLRGRRRFRFALVVAGLCFAIVAVSFTIRAPSTYADVTVVANGLAITDAHPWTAASRFVSGRLFVDNVDTLVPNWTSAISASTLELSATELLLTELTVRGASALVLSGDDRTMDLSVKGGGISGRVSFRDGSLRAGDVSRTLRTMPPEPPASFVFETRLSPAIGVPTRFSLSGMEAGWKLSGIQALTFSFAEEDPPGSGGFVSTVQSGTVEIGDTGRVYSIPANELLVIGAEDALQTSIASADTGLEVSLRGRFSEIRGYRGGRWRNLMPLLFEYVYTNERVVFFWTAAVFIIGTLWSLRNTIFKS